MGGVGSRRLLELDVERPAHLPCVSVRQRARARTFAQRCGVGPSPTLLPTDPVPRGLLTLCPWASSGPQGLYTAYMQPIFSRHAADMQPTYSLHTALRSPLDCLLPRARGACSARPLLIHLECNVFCKTSILYNAMRAASHTCPESEPKEPRLPGPLRTRGRVLTRRGTRRE